MKNKVISTPLNQPSPIIPAVGELWKHKGAPTVYLRIDDNDGRNALVYIRTNTNMFYSVDLTCGKIVFTEPGGWHNTIELVTPIGVTIDRRIEVKVIEEQKQFDKVTAWDRHLS